jgi:hypothetical protein
MVAATKLFDAAPSSLVRHADQSHCKDTWGGTEIHAVVTIWFSNYQLTDCQLVCTQQCSQYKNIS